MTDSFDKLLDRDLAKAQARELIDAACPLLRELVNYATWVCARCMRAPDRDRVGEENEAVAPLVLFQQLIEQIDAVEVLLSESCANGAVPVLRSAFEAGLSLRYILASDAQFSQRSLAWLCAYIHRRIEKHEELDANTARGSNRVPILTEYLGAGAVRYDSRDPVKGLLSVLARPQFAALEADYQARVERNPRRQPEWFSLLGGPRNRRLLARFLNAEDEYLILYGPWSDIAHATDAAVYLAGPGNEPNEVAFRPIRFAATLPQRAFMAASFMLRGIRLMLQHFRPNEPGLKVWYVRDVKDRYRQLQALQARVESQYRLAE